MATEKLIHALFEETENLEAALGITSCPDNPLLLCRDHYNEACRKFHPQFVLPVELYLNLRLVSQGIVLMQILSLSTCEIDLVPTTLYSQQITCVPHAINYILV